MKRGEIWTLAGGGDYTGKPRLVVIVQADVFGGLNSLTICPFTSDPADLPLMRLAVELNDDNGLRATSRIMIDKVTTVPKAKLGIRIGYLGSRHMTELNRALATFLGLAG